MPHGEEILSAADIRVTAHARLAAKLLIFKTPPALARFWRKALNHRMSSGALGCVHPLAAERVVNGKSMWLECDPRYFCVIGLTLDNLTMEVITHESVHAGFAYAKRHWRDYWVTQGEDYDEEDVCYPAGRIAKRINTFLHDEGLYTR